MTRWIAFLRAVNVGGRRVKMDELREIFAALGPDVTDVETYQASGNVIFTSEEEDPDVLCRRVEEGLADALGYEVTAFLRTDQQVAGIADHRPFPDDRMEAATALNVAFLAAPPPEDAEAALRDLESDTDRFHLAGREIYWWCAVKQSESDVSNAVLERTLGQPSTLRTLRTVKALAQRYG